ncbi:MAG: glycosyltransferase family 1 protein [Anaerolineae bacterium]|nr:glycosyltransferase family 1 protein [Anaerolineae bacterium]
MAIYVDISAAVHHRAGLGRYAESLVNALAPLLPDNLTFFYNKEQGIEQLDNLVYLPYRTVNMGYKPWRMLVWLAQLARIPFNHLVPDATLFHATEHLLIPLRGVPTILTIHDLIFRMMPEHHKVLNRWYLNLALPLFSRRADHIVVVSEATRKAVMQVYKVNSEKISVIPEAAAPRFKPQSPEVVETIKQRYQLPEKYLLYVGTIEPRKNLLRLLKVWEKLYTIKEVPPLVIVGSRGWLSEDFFAALEASPVRNGALLTGYVRDADLPALYAGATAFVFPSLYEGFGLPPLEAMACGTPVVCSNTSSLPEVVGDAALLFDPTDELALADALMRITQNAELRGTLREQGLEQAGKFSWERTAKETMDVYQHILS